MNPASLPAVLAVQFLLAVASWPALRWTGWRRVAWFAALAACGMAAPLAIDAEHRLLRLLAALWASWMTSKLLDLCCGVRPDERIGVTEFLLYLVNPFWIARGLRPPKLPWSDDAKRLAWRGLCAVVLVAASAGAFQIDWTRWPFAVEHAVKAVLFISTVVAVTNTVAVTWRLAGGRGIDAMRRPLAASTPADFWRRWNLPARQFFRAYGFEPFGGLRHPVRALTMTFVASALGHEYIFSIAAGRLQGLQTAFFLTSGLAAAATLGVRPTGWRRAAWTMASLAFLLATAVLFGVSLNEIVPVYVPRDP